MTPDNTQFRTGVIKPVECLKEGWALIKDQYWLFLGITFVGIFVGSAVPIVLIGPMMVGIYMCFFRRMRGEPVEFGTLFKGFDYFAQGLIAALIQMIPMVVIMVPFYIIMFVVIMTSMPRGGRMDPDASTRFMLTFFGFEAVFVLAIVAVIPAKGACGASTIAANLAFQWKRSSGQRILLVDLDPLTGTISFMLKIKSIYSFLDALQRSQEPEL